MDSRDLLARYRQPRSRAAEPARRRWAPLVLVSALAVATTGLVARPLRGQTAMPAPSISTSGPFTLTAISPLPVSNGYRPVRVTLAIAKAVARDQVFEIRLTGTSWYGRQESVEVTQELVLPAGATSAQITILIPELANLANAAIRVYEDGLEISGLATGLGMSQFGGGADYSAVLPTVLVVGDTEVSSGVLARTIGRQEDYRWGFNSGGQPQPATALITLARQSVAELDERWLAYSGLDLVCLSLADAGRLSTQRPRVWSALLDWTAAGGNLIVFGVAPDHDATRAGRLLKPGAADSSSDGAAAPAADAAPTASDGQGATTVSDGPWPDAWRDWQPADPKAYSGRIQDADWQDYYQGLDDAAQANAEAAAQALSEAAVDGDDAGPAGTDPSADAVSADDGSSSSSTEPAQRPAPGHPEFLWRTFGLGAVVVHAAPDLFPGTPESWGWLLNTLSPDRWLWYRRHGFSNRQFNPDYWNFVLANVGRAPVFAFQVLISLFVVLIGPVNYFFCRRRRKLHLLLLTTPACAAAVAGALFCYALVSDGLYTRVRDRNLTWIDQPTGRATAWTRMSWYAGLTPSQLEFPADVMVIPLGPQGTVGVGAGRSQERAMEWVDQQRLTRGWLPARTPTQFVTVRARKTKARLEIAPPTSDVAGGTSPAWSVTNQLGSRVQRLFVVDDAGKLLTGEDIADGANAPLTQVELNQAGGLGAAFLDRARLAIPEGLDPNEVIGWTGYWYWGQGTTADPVWADSRAETFLREALVDPARLPPRSYVAVVDRSPEVLWGLSDPRAEADLHVVVGRW